MVISNKGNNDLDEKDLTIMKDNLAKYYNDSCETVELK